MFPAQWATSDVPLPTPGPHGEDGERGLLDDVSGMDLDELRSQRKLITDELRGVRYWRRVAQAQTDLLVASLVYTGHGDLDGQHGAAVPQRRPDSGERLERLRARSSRMAGYEQTLRADLELVTWELASRVTASIEATSATPA